MNVVWLALRSSAFWFGFALVTLVYGSLSPFFWRAPYPKRYALLKKWGKFNLWWLRITCNIRYQVWGLENVPAQGPLIIMANHQSTWETIAITQIFSQLRVTWVLKESLLKIPLFGWGLRLLDPIAIDRDEVRAALAEVKQKGQQRLEEGLTITIFPEGTRAKPDEKIPYKPGGAMLACAGSYPVLMLAHNAGYCWPRSGFLKYPGLITVSVSKPLDPTGMKTKELNSLVENWIETERARLPLPAEALKNMGSTH